MYNLDTSINIGDQKMIAYILSRLHANYVHLFIIPTDLALNNGNKLIEMHIAIKSRLIHETSQINMMIDYMSIVLINRYARMDSIYNQCVRHTNLPKIIDMIKFLRNTINISKTKKKEIIYEATKVL